MKRLALAHSSEQTYNKYKSGVKLCNLKIGVIFSKNKKRWVISDITHFYIIFIENSDTYIDPDFPSA